MEVGTAVHKNMLKKPKKKIINVSLDMANAFNALPRSVFLPIVRTHLPDLLPWVDSMYGSSTSLYFGDFSHPDLPPTTILSKTSSRQGCPLGAQLFALGLHPLLCSLAQVRKRVAAMLRDHLPDDFLPPPSIQTHLTESDQGNFVGNSLA